MEGGSEWEKVFPLPMGTRVKWGEKEGLGSPPTAPSGAAPSAHLVPQPVVLIAADAALPPPLLHAGCRLLQRCGQPGIALPQGLQLDLPFLHIGGTVGRGQAVTGMADAIPPATPPLTWERGILWALLAWKMSSGPWR